MALLIACSSRGDEFAAVARSLPRTSTCALPPMSAIARIRIRADLVAATGTPGDAAQLTAHRLGRRRRRPPVQRSRPAGRADRALRRPRPYGTHGRVHCAARALPSPAHERVPRAAGAQGLEVPARARGARGARWPDGARRAGLGSGRRAQAASAIRCGAGAGRRNRSTASPASPARAQLEAFLADTDILAVLLPLTPDTRGTIDAGSSPSCRSAVVTSGCRVRC